jgi:hypothetical protein
MCNKKLLYIADLCFFCFILFGSFCGTGV